MLELFLHIQHNISLQWHWPHWSSDTKVYWDNAEWCIQNKYFLLNRFQNCKEKKLYFLWFGLSLCEPFTKVITKKTTTTWGFMLIHSVSGLECVVLKESKVLSGYYWISPSKINGEKWRTWERKWRHVCFSVYPQRQTCFKKQKQTYIKGSDRMNLVHDCKQLLFSFYGIGTVCYIFPSTSDFKAELTWSW